MTTSNKIVDNANNGLPANKDSARDSANWNVIKPEYLIMRASNRFEDNPIRGVGTVETYQMQESMGTL